MRRLGIQGIVVSNHGGRQVDGGVSSLGVLPRIVDAVGDKLDIFFDSGIRSGADIAKAMALGARMCLIGRPYVYGLAIGGEQGVSHVLKTLLGDMELTLHLAGIQSSNPTHLNRGILEREDCL
jgi:lactate 2-monooxygenase